jgi:hypothetical protein
MADLSAIASMLSLSEIGTGGGFFIKVAFNGAWFVVCFCCGASVGTGGASCATGIVGVIGDTGGRSGDFDRDRDRDRNRDTGRSAAGTGEGTLVSRGDIGRSFGGEGIVNAGMLQEMLLF